MQIKRRLLMGLVLVMWASCAVSLATAPEGRVRPDSRQKAERILSATGVKGGLIVHVGCDNGELTAALHAGDRYLVHGLDAKAKNVEAAREHIRSFGSYGEVSAAKFDGKHLPYADNLVNLVVSEDLGDVPMSEVMRVLCPRGVAYIKRDGTWRRTIKPWPDDIDEWTHFLHDASNNAVAADTQVGPPRRLKWVCGPLWSRSHEFISSLCAMVSANGRLFYIFDEGLTSITTKSIPERWTLIGRDAFNGLLLWKRSMDKWGSEQWNKRALRSAPRTVPRRLVAEGDRVFVTLGYDGPVVALDAATGETLTTYEQTAGTEEMRHLQGILILRKGRNLVKAIEVGTGKERWHAGGNIQPLTLAAQDGRVFYQEGKRLLCRRLTDGKELWHTPCKPRLSLLLVHDDCVLLVVGPKLWAVSAETGESIWTADTRVPRDTLFAGNEQLWHWQGERIVGRDLGTGKLTTTLDTADVFSRGHHLRCYQSKATENFLITPYRGIEFISVTGGPHTQNDWVRGPCRYGIMPCNGLLYAPPHPCFCYPGVKLTGFNALAPVRTSEVRGLRSQSVQKGPAYGELEIRNLKSEIAAKPDAWPTYRHDARRSGSTACEVTPRVCEKWRVRLRGELTPPVASGDRVYVAAKNRHTLYALHIEDGRALWQFTADGRIDSPPTVYGQAILFGCADGSVYCLRASDGELVWRFRAAPSDEQIIAFGRLESPRRVHGTILIEDGAAYFTAGRSSYLDGGISVFALDPQTGKVLHKAQVDTWARTRKDAENKPFIPAYHIEGIQSDVLVSQGDYIYVGQVKFDRELVRQEVPYIMPDPNDKTVAMDLSGRPFVVEDAEPDQDYEKHQRDWLERTQKHLLQELRQAHGSYSLGHRKMGLHVFSTAGFLDDAWFNRTFWMYSATWPGYYIAHRGAKTGQLLVVGPEKTYAVQAYPSRNLQSPLFTPGEKGYLLLADKNEHEPFLDYRTRGTTKGWGFTRKQLPVWHRWLPVRIRAMVLAGGHLFVAGPPDVVDTADPYAAFEGRKGGKLWALSAYDGTKLAKHDLAMPPVFDGLIATKGRLVMSTVDGQVLCFAAEK
jgi:outer membrane protein assembly factor BamB